MQRRGVSRYQWWKIPPSQGGLSCRHWLRNQGRRVMGERQPQRWDILVPVRGR